MGGGMRYLRFQRWLDVLVHGNDGLATSSKACPREGWGGHRFAPRKCEKTKKIEHPTSFGRIGVRSGSCAQT